MKTSYSLSPQLKKLAHLFLILSLFIFIASCEDKMVQTVSWVEFEPVYMSEAEFKNAVDLITPGELENPGKIFFINDYLFVNEKNDGIHIIDNRDPANPVNIGFINIPANKDMAVKDNKLYADSGKDLLVFDITELSNPILLSRTEDVFENWDGPFLGFPFQPIEPEKGIVVDWKEVIVEEVCETDNCMIGSWGRTWVELQTSTSFVSTDAAGSTGGTGIAGSMARFAAVGDYLYAVDFSSLIAFNISGSAPIIEDEENIGWGLETIFPYNQHLYVGSAQAMYILDISYPEAPTLMSTYAHLTACDPVVVQGTLAYVTLRSGNRCPRAENELEIINVEDPANPFEVKSYTMLNPHGLGIDGNTLFISEGDNGLKVYDAEDPMDLKLIRFIDDIMSYDVIPYDSVLMVTGASGIVQYDYSDINDIKRLSIIPVSGQ